MRVERLSPADVRPLRRAVLRPHQRADDLDWPGDGDPRALHVGVRREDGELIGVASVVPVSGPHGDWRVRGMAVDPAARGTGVGAAMVEALLDHVRAQGGTRAWCDARVNVAAFYERAGFARVGEEFDKGPIGMHVPMARDV